MPVTAYARYTGRTSGGGTTQISLEPRGFINLTSIARKLIGKTGMGIEAYHQGRDILRLRAGQAEEYTLHDGSYPFTFISMEMQRDQYVDLVNMLRQVNGLNVREYSPSNTQEGLDDHLDSIVSRLTQLANHSNLR